MARLSGGQNPASKPKAAPMKVSQATINRIKGDGMAAALRKAASSATKGTNASYVEGVKRIYGATRLNAAKAKMVSGGQPAGYRNKAAQATASGQPAGYRNRAAQTKKASTSYSPAPMSAERKKRAGFRAKYIDVLAKNRVM
jgi:hypothetical protein